MKRTYVGPFSRFAFEEAKDGFVVYDAEVGGRATAVKVCASEKEARAYIAAQIAADPTMREEIE